MANQFVVATIKPWNIEAFARNADQLPGKWTIISNPDKLILRNLQELMPRYVFFPHWSWRVPGEITRAFECVCFHESDVPYGRGGSPIQNLIMGGHGTTVISAIRMTDEFDGGPVYMKRPLSLVGRAQEIFERAAQIVVDMMHEMALTEPLPLPQTGEATYFIRRTPAQSLLPDRGSPAKIYDFVRMLDADTYPKAFIEWGDFRIEFDQATFTDTGDVEARAVVRRNSNK
jgi:methionyl-tRNA formyltransferase